MKQCSMIQYLLIIFLLSLNITISYSQQKSVKIAMAQIFCLDGDR
jgi:hypothetical protein